jgi:hypothetical protein
MRVHNTTLGYPKIRVEMESVSTANRTLNFHLTWLLDQEESKGRARTAPTVSPDTDSQLSSHHYLSGICSLSLHVHREHIIALYCYSLVILKQMPRLTHSLQIRSTPRLVRERFCPTPLSVVMLKTTLYGLDTLVFSDSVFVPQIAFVYFVWYFE